MKSSRLLPLLFLICSPLWVHAQTVFEQNPPVGQNVRMAWAIDADGGVEGDEFSGFELAYASVIYPLDQMVITYGHSNPSGNTKDTILLSIEEYYPLAEMFKLYGVAGFGYMWNEFKRENDGHDTGAYGKIGGGAIYTLSESFDLYAELAYYASTRDLWLDGGNDVDAKNWGALIGFRFKY